MKYVSLDLAKKHLYIETEYTDDDSIIGVYVAAAEGAVANHIRRDLDTLEDSEGKLPDPILSALSRNGRGTKSVCWTIYYNHTLITPNESGTVT